MPSPNLSNLSLLERIKAAQQQLNTKPEVKGINQSRSSSSDNGYRAPPIAPVIEKVSVPRGEDPMSVPTVSTTSVHQIDNLIKEEQVEDTLHIEEDVAFIHGKDNAELHTEVSSSETTVSSSTNYSTRTREEDNLQCSSFHIEPMISNMYQGIQKRVDHFLRPVPSYTDNDTDEPLLMKSQNNDVASYSLKQYCSTMGSKMYHFTVGRFPPEYRMAVVLSVIALIFVFKFAALYLFISKIFSFHLKTA